MKNLFIFVIVLLSVACTRGHDEVVVNMDTPQTTKISKEQALKNLYSELKIIDGATRSDGSSRSVKSIKELKGAVTRSGDALANDLLYIVEFEEGQGSAVVAADARLDPVIAVLDSSVITEEDFSSTNTEDIGVYMASMISDYAASVTSSEGPYPFLPAPAPGDNYDTITYSRGPLLKTKWNQNYPYNNLCRTTSGLVAKAGCVPIAIAQFLYQVKPNEDMVINNTSVTTKNLTSLEYGHTPTNIGITNVALLVSSIGLHIGANYGITSTTAALSNSPELLQTLGFNNASYIGYNSFIVFDKINNNKSILIRGTDSDRDTGHAWVIDGYIEHTITQRKYTADGGYEPIYSSTVYKIHCNFGWAGVCDGYYSEYVFNTRIKNYELENNIGDVVGTNAGCYDYRICIVNY